MVLSTQENVHTTLDVLGKHCTSCLLESSAADEADTIRGAGSSEGEHGDGGMGEHGDGGMGEHGDGGMGEHGDGSMGEHGDGVGVVHSTSVAKRLFLTPDEENQLRDTGRVLHDSTEVPSDIII